MNEFFLPHARIFFLSSSTPQDLLTWHDALAIAVVIFAITQFMENTKLRKYLFYFGWLRNTTVFLTGIPILLVVISTIISFFHLEMVDLPLAFIFLNPIIYQTTALASFSLLIILYLYFLFKPGFFKPRLSIQLLKNIASELIDNTNQEEIAALCKIVGVHLEEIINLASTVPREFPGSQVIVKIKNKELAAACLEFIDYHLSEQNFIQYISRNDFRFVHHSVENAIKYRLWEVGGGRFFDNLFHQLLDDGDSVLSKELQGSYKSVPKKLSKLIFGSLELIANYDVFGTFGLGADVSKDTLDNLLRGLEISLREYFREVRNIYYGGTPSRELGNVLTNLGESFKSMCVYASKDKEKYSSKISAILDFYRRLTFILTPTAESRWEEAYEPKFAPEELSVEKGSITESIVKGLFNLYEGLSWLKDEEYARMYLLTLYELVMITPQSTAQKAVQDKLLEKIKERVEQNLQHHYPSIVKLLLNFYGVRLWTEDQRVENNIDAYFKEVFKTKIVLAIRNDQKFREYSMPSDWFLDDDGTIYTHSIDGEKVVIDKPVTKKRK